MQDHPLGFTVSMDQPPVVSKHIHWSFTRAGHEAMDIAGSVRQTFSLDKLTLTISDLNTGDEGTYTILASNQVGSSSATVFLDVQGTQVNGDCALSSSYHHQHHLHRHRQ